MAWGKLILFFCLVIAMTAVLAWPRNEQRELERAIQARYDQFNQAWMIKDRAKVEDVFAPECDFKQSDEAGGIKLPKFMKGIEFSFRSMTVLKAVTQIDSLARHQDFIEVKAKILTETQLNPTTEEVKSQPPRVNRSTQVVRDQWKHTPDGWRIFMRVIEQ